jgi:acyl carrier protein
MPDDPQNPNSLGDDSTFAGDQKAASEEQQSAADAPSFAGDQKAASEEQQSAADAPSLAGDQKAASEEQQSAGDEGTKSGEVDSSLSDLVDDLEMPKVTAPAASIEQRVFDLVAQNLGAERSEIAREKTFIGDLSADSLDIVELIMDLEEEFDLDIPEDEAEKIETVGQAIDYIESTKL